MQRFAIIDLLALTLLAAVLLAIAMLPGGTTTTRTYTISSAPPSDDSLQGWLLANGWSKAMVARDGQSVTISAPVSFINTGGPAPDWDALGYTGVAISRSTTKHSNWILPKLAAVVCVIIGFQYWRARRK